LAIYTEYYVILMYCIWIYQENGNPSIQHEYYSRLNIIRFNTKSIQLTSDLTDSGSYSDIVESHSVVSVFCRRIMMPLNQNILRTLFSRELEKPRRRKKFRALSAHSAAEFNISPGRWQHLWLVAIVSPKRWGKWTEMTATQHGGTLRH
jgi:hypothetical protein